MINRKDLAGFELWDNEKDGTSVIALSYDAIPNFEDYEADNFSMIGAFDSDGDFVANAEYFNINNFQMHNVEEILRGLPSSDLEEGE